MRAGGGTAGLAIATRLAQGSHSVAVIEAGSFYEIGNSNFSQVPLYAAAFSAKSPFQESPQVDWGFVTTPQPVSIMSPWRGSSHLAAITHNESLGFRRPSAPVYAWQMLGR